MIQVFQVFKLVMGIMISIFILYFLVNYAGSYATVQEEMRLGKVLQNFDKGARDVYTTGNPAPYDGFSKVKGEVSFDVTPPAGLFTELGKQSLSVPTFFVIDDKMLLGRGEQNLGWYKFTYVVAVPETQIIFNPMTEDARDLIEDVVEMTPSTMGFEPKIVFGFCDGTEIDADFCGPGGDQPCEKELFLKELKTADMSTQKCRTYVGPNRKLFTISSACSLIYTDTGVCAKLPNAQGMGDAFVYGVGEFRYHDALDLLVLLIGGNRMDPLDVFGYWAENMYIYKNRVFAEEVGRVARVTADTSDLVASALTSEFEAGYINELSDYYECIPIYGELSDTLGQISEILSEEGYHEDFGKLAELHELQNTAKTQYMELANRGCEPIV